MAASMGALGLRVGFKNLLKTSHLPHLAAFNGSTRSLNFSSRNPTDFLRLKTAIGSTSVRFYSSNDATGSKNTAAPPTGSITEQFMQSKIAAQESNSGEKEGSKDETKEKEKPSSKWTGKNAWKLGLVFMGGGAVVVGGMILYEWGSPRVDKDGNVVVDEFTELPQWQQIPKRAWREFNFYKQMIRDPSSEKLLPDPLREPYYQPPYTLVLEMTGVLVHPDWTYGTGWRFKKRPGIDYFLQQVGPPLFEVVIYTREQGFTASPILDSLDPNGYITYRLYKDATRYMNGAHIKDLSCLNRDESKVIMVDCDASAVQIQPRNAITLKRWRGADDDRSLVELASLLRAIAASNVDDVRTVLDYYNAHDDPLDVFRENQRKWQEEQERIDAAKQTEQQNQPLVKSYAPGFFRRR